VIRMFEMIPWVSGANCMKRDFVRSAIVDAFGLCVSTRTAALYTAQSLLNQRVVPQPGQIQGQACFHA
jgi:hypothetical protein